MLYGAGEWLVEKHGTRTRRSRRKLRIGLDAGTGQIVAVTLTRKELDDGAEAASALVHTLDSLDLVITGVVMPGANGPTLAGRLRAERPCPCCSQPVPGGWMSG